MQRGARDERPAAQSLAGPTQGVGAPLRLASARHGCRWVTTIPGALRPRYLARDGAARGAAPAGALLGHPEHDIPMRRGKLRPGGGGRHACVNNIGLSCAMGWRLRGKTWVWAGRNSAWRAAATRDAGRATGAPAASEPARLLFLRRGGIQGPGLMPPARLQPPQPRPGAARQSPLPRELCRGGRSQA